MRLLLLCLLLSTFSSIAQIGTGEWRLHIPAKRALDVVKTSNKVFTAFANGISEYDISSNELSTWDVVTGLSDITISCMGHSSVNDAVFIGYENGNIDRILGNKVTNIPAIKLAEIQGSKKIYKIVEHDGYLYFATGFGIVKIDPVRSEVKDTYYPSNGNTSIIDVSFRNDSIFALTEKLMYFGDINNIALPDPAEWTIDPRVPNLSSNAYKEIEQADGEMYLLYKDEIFGGDSIYRITETALESVISETFTMEIRGIDVLDNELTVHYYGASIIYDNNYTSQYVLAAYPFGNPEINTMLVDNGEYWIADNSVGLVHINGGLIDNIVFPGPPRGEFYGLDWSRGKLIVTCGAASGNGSTFKSSGVYTFEDEEWGLYNEANTAVWESGRIWDYLAVAIDPNDKEKFAISSWSFTPITLFDEGAGTIDTLTPNNSALMPTNVGIGATLVTGLEYDVKGNLWVLNGGSNEPLKVLTKDGEWQVFDLGTEAKGQFSQRLVIDNEGNKWVSFREVGVYGYNDNGTPTDLGDDEMIRLTTGANTGDLPSNRVTALAVDLDNELWIGTDAGFAVLYNADNAFGASSGEYNAQRIKVEFEGNVEYVLGATGITDIEVDGANRKWMATENSGIILLSPDGLEIIQQFTVENSPLISNNIIELELDHNTGELFIVTDKGLISYRTDATEGKGRDYEDVTVFPNPVRPGFTGVITMQGIQYDSDVKVTDASGKLVYRTTSNGGTATWDGKTLNGDPVATGVYLIWTAPNEGKGRKVGKILVVR
ncbi:MAG: T9SS type A sorting domain-containing protein [Crocinitomicaceae bacterium]|nr:T9SS type A sorting domain-containing protein [Flavobacteriales bacterium]NQZ36648.1 T9SS type A sorting domain-containing protein [Crocinitomicaceae bacterium]